MEISTILWILSIIAVAGLVLYMVLGKKRPPHKTELPQVKYNVIKAKKAFLCNLETFSTLLPSLKEGVEVEKWTAAIITINDPDLIGVWKKYIELEDFISKWIQLLASWQVKNDTCKSFTCLTEDNTAAYCMPDGSMLTQETKYKVISPCWVYTYEDELGQTKKRVVSKGIVIPYSE